MAAAADLRTEETAWRGRRACRLANGQIELVTLLGGGHLASLRLTAADEARRVNVLWEAPWPLLEPEDFRPEVHEKLYGAAMVGRFLAAYTGHGLCLGWFGAPAESEAALGLPLHGEAASLPWTVERAQAGETAARLALEVRCPHAGLKFRREISCRSGEPVVYFRETVANERAAGQAYQWVEHAAFGPPLLAAGASRVSLPGRRAKTWPHGYEGKSLLPDDARFRWPRAPRRRGGRADLSRPFAAPGKGFVAGVELDHRRAMAWVAVLNWRLGLAAGYLFRREDFPWVAVWEENRARQYAPWNGACSVRGLEFGTSPMPLGLRQAALAGPLFGMPTVAWLDGRASRTAGYAAFVAAVPPGWRGLAEVRAGGGRIELRGPRRGERLRLPAAGLEEIGFD